MFNTVNLATMNNLIIRFHVLVLIEENVIDMTRYSSKSVRTIYVSCDIVLLFLFASYTGLTCYRHLIFVENTDGLVVSVSVYNMTDVGYYVAPC